MMGLKVKALVRVEKGVLEWKSTTDMRLKITLIFLDS